MTKKAEWIELDAVKAKELCGFRTELKEGERGYAFTNAHGQKKRFVLDRNRDNRPFKLQIAERYRDRFLRGEWAGQWNHPSDTDNGESWVFDRSGQIVSCAHRLVGLILAQERRDLLERFGLTEELEDYSTPDKIVVSALMVTGIDPAAADTADTGQTRSLGDVLFRRHTLANGKDLSPSAKVRLNRELAVAVRLLWLRLRGEAVSGGGKLDFPEALAFLEAHPLLTDCLLHVYNEDGGGGEGGKRISPYITFGYAAAMMYLEAFSDSVRGEYQDGSLDTAKKPKRWDKAEKFWTMFAAFSAKSVKNEDAPSIGALHTALTKNRLSQDDKYSRDAICTLVTRAWLSYSGDEKGSYETPKALTAKLFIKDGDREILNFARFGGLDVSKEVLVENGWFTDEPDLTRRKVDGWKIGDTGWVDQPNLDPWLGEIVGFSADGKSAEMKSMAEEDDGAIFSAQLDWLKADKPEREPPKTEEETKAEAPKKPVAKKPPKKPAKVPATAAI